MPQHLRDAAQRRHEETTERATIALARLSAAGKAITFASVAREADVSTDFLYRQPHLRERIRQLRTSSSQCANSPYGDDGMELNASAPVRALSAQLKELRRRHHKEVTDLKEALAVAHGETLALRRKLAAYE
jgi:hypothetical protein